VTPAVDGPCHVYIRPPADDGGAVGGGMRGRRRSTSGICPVAASSRRASARQPEQVGDGEQVVTVTDSGEGVGGV
jgi:hypothetical protein